MRKKYWKPKERYRNKYRIQQRSALDYILKASYLKK